MLELIKQANIYINYANCGHLMPYDDIYPVIFQGLALNGFEVALSDTVGIDDRRKCDFIVFVCEAGLRPRLYRKI